MCGTAERKQEKPKQQQRNIIHAFSKVYTIKFRQYINLQCLLMGRVLMEIQSDLRVFSSLTCADPAAKHGLMQVASHSCFKLILLGGG